MPSVALSVKPSRRLGCRCAIVAVMTTMVVAGASAASSQAAERTTQWRFGGISPSQSTLRIITRGGGCSQPLPPLVEETASAVRITARNMEPDERGPCTADIRFDTRYVSLAAPLAGRKLSGASPADQIPSPSVPRVVGLSPGDAVTALQAAGASPKIVRRRTVAGLRRVIGQRGERLIIDGSG